eukprot:g35048.t1
MKTIDEGKAVDVVYISKAFDKVPQGSVVQKVNHMVSGVVSARNELPKEVVEADTIAAIKKHLNEYMDRKGMEGYGSRELKANVTYNLFLDFGRQQGRATFLSFARKLTTNRLHSTKMTMCEQYTIHLS